MQTQNTYQNIDKQAKDYRQLTEFAWMMKS